MFYTSFICRIISHKQERLREDSMIVAQLPFGLIGSTCLNSPLPPSGPKHHALALKEQGLVAPVNRPYDVFQVLFTHSQ